MIYFISGHRDLTISEFVQHYVPRINAAIKDGASFVVGDYTGADYYAQIFLSRFPRAKAIIYHMGNAPMHVIEGFELKGGFKTDEERDAAMTKISGADIAWVRRGKEDSGTAQNINRRLK